MDDLGIAQQSRDARERLEMVGARALRRKQEENQIDRLVVERFEIDRPVEAREQTEQLVELGQLAMRNGNAIADAGRAQLLTLQQDLEDLALALAGHIDDQQIGPPGIRETPREQGEQLSDMGSAFLGLGLSQQLLDLLPRQLRLAQDAADGVASREQVERLEDPLLEFLDRPVVTGQAVLRGGGVFHRGDDLLYLRLGKRGERPPLWR